MEKISGKKIGTEWIEEMTRFAEKELFISLPENFSDFESSKKIKFFSNKFNRPLRICGMVKNEGEPGGGPFLINEKDGGHSLQIVESSQLEMKNPQQKKIFDAATHFNPVDLVCGVRDYKGVPFDLMKFRNPDTGFISVKSKDGKELKAQELPGLWNGAMAYWNTIFVEVPIITFNPVKVINDLLKPEHQ